MGMRGFEEATGGVTRDATRERIIDAALEVLREVGHGQFSVQKVARRAGVYQGNITYYWPRRRDLVLALAARVIEDYRVAALSALGDDAADPEQRAQAAVRALVEQAVQADRVRVLPELWSMANADPQIAAAVIAAHDDAISGMLRSLGLGDDAPCAADVQRVLLVTGAAIQGLTTLHGHRSVEDPLLVEAKLAVIAQHAALLRDALAGCKD